MQKNFNKSLQNAKIRLHAVIEYDDNDEYSMMISETDTVTLVEHALFVYLIAYDFGCSSHTVMEESLLEGAEVNRRNSASIETVQTRAAMHSYTK